MIELAEEATSELYREREERITDAINLDVPDRVPVISKGKDWYFTKLPDVSKKDMLTDNEKFMKAQVKYYLDYSPDAVWMQLTQDPLGTALIEPCQMKFPWREESLDDNGTPKVVSKEIMKREDYDYLLENGYLDLLMKLLPKLRPNVSNVREKLLDKLGVSEDFDEISPLQAKENTEVFKKLGFPAYFPVMFLSPFNCLTLLRSYPKMCMDINNIPDTVEEAMNKIIPEIIEMSSSIAKNLNSPRVFLGLHRESATFFSPDVFDDLLFPQIKKMVDLYTEKGFKVILHCDGNWDPLLERMRDLPKKSCVIQLDPDTDVYKAKEVIGDRQCIEAGPMEMEMARKSPQEVEEHCKELIDKVGKGGGFILKTEIPPNGKKENVRTLINTAKTYGIY